MKKLLLILLAAVMVFSIFACTKKENKNPAVTTAPGTTGGPDVPPATTTPETTTKDPNKPDLEPMTFDGLEYRVATREGNLKVEVFADETAVDIRQTALQQRNATVEDAYDVIISPYVSADNSLRGQTTELMNLIYAEEDVYDISLTYAAATGSFVVGGYVINWKNLKHNDFSKYYWMNDINKNLIIDDAIYTVVGDMCISTITNTYAMFYNRTEGDKIMMEDGSTTMTEEVFEKIEDMEWTIDYFIDLVANIYQDIDDTTGISEDDFFGFTGEALTNLDIWQFAFDIPMLTHDETDGLKCIFNTEKTATMIDKLNELYWENNGSLIINSGTTKFKNGNVVFHTTWLDRCFGTFKDMEEQYTILPYPMFDENQEKYMAGAMDNYNIICIPFTCTELEMVSYITEVLNYESREQLYPVYYEESLQKQYTRDPESIEMLDLIMEGRNFDLGTLFPSQTNGLCMMVRSCVGSKNSDFATFFAEKEEGVNQGLKNLVEQYELNKRTGEE